MESWKSVWVNALAHFIWLVSVPCCPLLILTGRTFVVYKRGCRHHAEETIMKICTVAEMRNFDRLAIERYGIPDQLLMENAGMATYLVVADTIGVRGRKFVIVCGLGNNGGDGFVVARKLHSNGARVKVFIVGDRSRYQGSARLNLDIISGLDMAIAEVTQSESLRSDLVHSDGVIDALFGTGLDRDVSGLFAEAIDQMNRCAKPVISVDIPSGVHGNTGQVMGIAVKATATVTFGLPKVGNLLYPGFQLCGRLYVSHISFPPELYQTAGIAIETNDPAALPERPVAGHKGSFGDVLFIAGAATYYGAPCFSALSFLLAGGGYSRLAAPKSMVPFLAARAAELVFVPMQETRSGSISKKNRDALIELSEQVDCVVMGPGLSLDSETQELVRQLAREIKKPLLLDGDGITAVCQDLEVIKDRHYPTVLTPHPGEMSRLMGISLPEITNDTIVTLQKACAELNCLIVLKGAHSLTGAPDGQIRLNLSGNSGMATAGSGDVLTGTIAAMFGLGLPFEQAVRNGVFMHGLAGDLAALDYGQDGLTAQTIMDYLPEAVKVFRQGLPDILQERYRIAVRI